MYRERALAVFLFPSAFISCGLAISPVATTAASESYDRSSWKHWVDEDSDCQDTRQEVLIEESRVDVTLDERGCKVIAGEWVDPYTGNTYTSPKKLDIDHVVPLRDAHDSGGYHWSAAIKEMFANDMANSSALRAVYLGANRSKGSRGPDQWLPTNEAFRCQYIEEYMAIKDTWELDSSQGQRAVVSYMRKICDEGGIPPLPQ